MSRSAVPRVWLWLPVSRSGVGEASGRSPDFGAMFVGPAYSRLP
jgi:hypothetical protein